MEFHNCLFSLKKDDDVRALRDWLEFALERLIHIYMEHVVDEDQGNEGDDEHEFHKEVDKGVGVDDNFFDEDNADLVGDSVFDRYERPSSPIDPSTYIAQSIHIVQTIAYDQSNVNPNE